LGVISEQFEAAGRDAIILIDAPTVHHGALEEVNNK
jgi:hypothetical protein